MEVRELNLFGVTIEVVSSDFVPKGEVRLVDQQSVRVAAQLARTYAPFFGSKKRAFDAFLSIVPVVAKITNCT